MNTRIMSYTLLLSGMCLLGLSVTAAPTNSPKKGAMTKIAVVDVRRMLTQDPQLLKEDASVSHEWRELYNTLQETLKPINDEMKTLQAQYQEKVQELEKLQKSGVSSQEALQKKYKEEVAPFEYRYQAQSQRVQNFSYAELNKIQGVVGPKIQKATDKVAQAQGWDFVISKDVIASTFASGSRFNVTDDVLAIINADYAKTKAAAPKKDAKA